MLELESFSGSVARLRKIQASCELCTHAHAYVIGDTDKKRYTYTSLQNINDKSQRDVTIVHPDLALHESQHLRPGSVVSLPAATSLQSMASRPSLLS